MASWSVLLALSGQEYDGVKKHLGFAPRITPGDFRSFFSTGSAWGTFSQRQMGRQHQATLDVVWGNQTLKTLSFASYGRAARRRVSANLDNKPVELTSEITDGKIVLTFPSPIEIKAGGRLEVVF
jgi:hypothetical protein